jgi:hypothetical protein
MTFTPNASTFTLKSIRQKPDREGGRLNYLGA